MGGSPDGIFFPSQSSAYNELSSFPIIRGQHDGGLRFGDTLASAILQGRPNPSSYRHFSRYSDWVLKPVLVPTGLATGMLDDIPLRLAGARRPSALEHQGIPVGFLRSNAPTQELAVAGASERPSEKSNHPDPDKIAAIVFNEAQSLHGEGISEAWERIAHVLINRADAGKPLGTGTAAPQVDPTSLSPDQRRIFGQIKGIVTNAISDSKQGYDPTNGAQEFNMRGVDPGQDPLEQFYNVMKPRRGRVRVDKPYGPFRNSAPSKVLPEGSDVYINFYH